MQHMIQSKGAECVAQSCDTLLKVQVVLITICAFILQMIQLCTHCEDNSKTLLRGLDILIYIAVYINIFSIIVSCITPLVCRLIMNRTFPDYGVYHFTSPSLIHYGSSSSLEADHLRISSVIVDEPIGQYLHGINDFVDYSSHYETKNRFLSH